MSAGLDRVGLEEVLGRFVHEHRDELSTDAARCANRLRDVLGERVGLTGRQARALAVLVADGSVARWLIEGQADGGFGLDVDNVHKWATSSWSAALGFGGGPHAPPVSVSRSSGFPDELVDIGPQRRRSSGAIRFAQRPGGGLVRLSTVDGSPQTLAPDSVRDQLSDLPAGVMRVDWVEQSERSVTFASRASSTRSLAQHVETDGKLDPRVALPILSVVADTLTECHRLGMPHGALTLDSVLLDDADRPMVADVGLCRAVGRPATTASDAQAFASICYSTLTGEPPPTDDPGSVPDWRRLPILEVSPTVPGDVARAIESYFEGTPDETSDIAQLADVLRTATAGRPLVSWPAPSPTNQNHGPDQLPGGPISGDHDHRPGTGGRVETGTSTVTAQTTDPRKLALIGVIVAGLVVLVAIGFVLLRGGSDDSDVITTSIAEISPGSVVFEPLAFGDDFVAERTWTISDGLFEGRTTIANDGDDAIEIAYDEVIPKDIARSAADLTFSPGPAAIIEDDPIVRFVTTIEGGESFIVTYATNVSTEPTTAVLESWTEAWDVAYRAHVAEVPVTPPIPTPTPTG